MCRWRVYSQNKRNFIFKSLIRRHIIFSPSRQTFLRRGWIADHWVHWLSRAHTTTSENIFLSKVIITAWYSWVHLWTFYGELLSGVRNSISIHCVVFYDNLFIYSIKLIKPVYYYIQPGQSWPHSDLSQWGPPAAQDSNLDLTLPGLNKI